MSKNNTTGFKGVTLKNGKYEANIRTNGVTKYIGTFIDAESAGTAYDVAARKYHGEFAGV